MLGVSSIVVVHIMFCVYAHDKVTEACHHCVLHYNVTVTIIDYDLSCQTSLYVIMYNYYGCLDIIFSQESCAII